MVSPPDDILVPLALKAADLRDKNLPPGKNASMAKYYAAEVANEIAAKAVQIII